MFVGVVGGTALLLGLLGFALVQHSRRKAAAPTPPSPFEPRFVPGAARPGAHADRHDAPRKKCVRPAGRNTRPKRLFARTTATGWSPHAATPSPRGRAAASVPSAGRATIQAFLTCPKHGEELLPAAVHTGVRSTDGVITKKICPVCGKQFSGDSQFCGTCGASLVPVN